MAKVQIVELRMHADPRTHPILSEAFCVNTIHVNTVIVGRGSGAIGMVQPLMAYAWDGPKFDSPIAQFFTILWEYIFFIFSLILFQLFTHPSSFNIYIIKYHYTGKERKMLVFLPGPSSRARPFELRHLDILILHINCKAIHGIFNFIHVCSMTFITIEAML
jgi:hypothetical protein